MILISIIVGIFSGCLNDIDYTKIKIVPNFTASFIPVDLELGGAPGWGNVRVNFSFRLPADIPYKPLFVKEFTYAIYGNGYYVGGNKITTSTNFSGFVEDYLRILDVNSSTDPSTYEWLVDINQELKNDLLQKKTVHWTVTGELSFYKFESEIITVPFEDSFDQSEY